MKIFIDLTQMKRGNNTGIFILVLLAVFLFLNCNQEEQPYISETVFDYEGNVYHTVKICDQVWLVENLKSTKFKNGEPISKKLYHQWEFDREELNVEPAHCNYADDEANGEV